MPQPHEVRTSGGETRMWNGSRWEPVSTDHEPDTYAGGFMKSAGKTIGDTAKGVAEGLNPIDALKGFLGLPGQVVKGYGSLIDLAQDPSLLKEAPAAITQGTSGLSDPETGGKTIGNLITALVTGRLAGPAMSAAKSIPRVAEAIGTPALNIAEQLPMVGKAIKATRTELPAMMEGLKKISGGASDASTVTGMPGMPRPGRTMNTGRASESTEKPYRMGSGVSDPTNVTDISDTRIPGAAASSPSPSYPSPQGYASGAGRQSQLQGVFGSDPNEFKPPSSFISDIQGVDDIPRGASQTIEPAGGPIGSPIPMEHVPTSKARQAQLAAKPLMQQAPAAAPASNLRALPRVDEQWGPGATTKSGEFAQADLPPSNLKYDPQTPTSYLREQLQGATDPAEREFLAKALAQRSLVDRAKAASSGFGPQ